MYLIQGFEEPDLDGFRSSDSESEPELEPCGPRTPRDTGSHSSPQSGDAWGKGREDDNGGGKAEDCLVDARGLSSASPGSGTAKLGDDHFGKKEDVSEGLPLNESSRRLDAGQQEGIAATSRGKDFPAAAAAPYTGAHIEGLRDGSRFDETWNDSVCGDDNDNVDVPGSLTVGEEENPDGSETVAKKEREEGMRDGGSMGEEGYDLGKPPRDRTREASGFGQEVDSRKAFTLGSEGAADVVGVSSDKRIEIDEIVDLMEGDVLKSSSRHSGGGGNSEVSDSEVSDWDKSLNGSPALGVVGDLKLKALRSMPSKGGGGRGSGVPSSRWGGDRDHVAGEGRGGIAVPPRGGVTTVLASPVGRDLEDLTDFDKGSRAVEVSVRCVFSGNGGVRLTLA